MNTKRTALYSLTSAALLTASLSANAMFCANCATRVQAAQEYAKEVQQTVNQVTSLSHQVQSIGYQIQNLKNLPAQEWGNAITQINQLGDIARQGDSLGYSLANINDEWQQRFKGYDGWTKDGTDPKQVSEQYRLWGDTMRDTAKSALQVASQMQRVQSQDDSTLQTLQNQSENANGALQVAQAGNELVAQTTRQMQKVQTLLQTDIQMTATTMATASEKEEQMKAADAASIAVPHIDTESGHDWSKPWTDTHKQW